MNYCASQEAFPSPTGVTYYEFFDELSDYWEKDPGVRPQQGLLIMNEGEKMEYKKENYEVSVPNRGYLL